MKKQIQLVIAILIAVLAAGLAYAQESLPMIASRDLLRSYAVEHISKAEGYTYSQSSVPSQGETYFAFPVTDRPVSIEKLRQEVGKYPLTPAIANPADYVGFVVRYLSRDEDILFQGGTSVKFVRNAETGRWELPPIDGPELNLNYEIPITVSNVNYAYVILTDENGNTVRYENVRADREAGKIYYPSFLAGAAGYLVVNSYDHETGKSSSRIYDMRTGKATQPATDSVALSPSIRDFPEVTLSPADPGVIIEVESHNGSGESPTVEVTVTNKPGNTAPVFVTVTARTTEGEVPEMVCFRRIGREVSTELRLECVPAFTEGRPTQIKLQQGLYHFFFKWKTFRPFPAIPSEPSKGGGGGKG